MHDKKSLQKSLSGQAALLTELLSNALEPSLRKFGLTPAVFDLLTAVHANEDGISQADLARRLRVSAPTLSEAVHSAEAKGFLLAKRSTSDRRLRVIHLTNVGKTAVEHALRELNLLEMQVVEEIDNGDVQVALSVLRKLNQRMAARLRTMQ
jgi:MarR family transcriptional regulator, transcriptional regulator for hemolysin